jgi:hypothetical protein
MGNVKLREETFIKKIYTADELEGDAFKKAYTEFIDFIMQESNIIQHTHEEFIEVSNVNGWKYEYDGSLY